MLSMHASSASSIIAKQAGMIEKTIALTVMITDTCATSCLLYSMADETCIMDSLAVYTHYQVECSL